MASGKLSSPNIKIQDVPDVPQIGTATIVNKLATITFTPAATGGTPVQFRAISTPDNTEAVGTSSPISFTLPNVGTSYSLKVRSESLSGATNGYSGGSNSVVPVDPPTVTGGTLASDSTYYYRVFTANGTLSVSNGTLPADIFVIAGGGSGGCSTYYYQGGSGGQGGGGAGGAALGNTTLASGSYSITIGAGGAGQYAASRYGYNGTDSSFGSLITTYGGGAGGYGVNVGSGGSGGGAGYNGSGGGVVVATLTIPGTSYGNVGGSAIAAGNGSGGGGGTGTAGLGPTTNTGGNGTTAISSWLATVGSTMPSAFQTATASGYIGGGGGGGTGVTHAGGYGGGGTGGVPNVRTQPAVNTGSGSGGVEMSRSGGNYDAQTYAGASGIVIVRYLKTNGI